MLIIRREQIDIFRQSVRLNFENNMVKHLRDFTPGHSEALGEDGLRKVIRQGIKSAETYGLTDYGPVRFYIELMFILGSDFDTDCQFPWASHILADPEIVDQTERADALFDKAMDYLKEVAGPERKYAKESLRRASQQSFKDLGGIKENLETEILAWFRKNYPQKCRYVGEQPLHDLIRRAAALARKIAVSNSAGVVLCACFMFMLGHGFAEDPLYPWCKKTLNDENITDPNKRLERLHSKGIAYISKVLE
ncbi:MAG TPA: hypothetical protein ENK33_08870 [Desulfobacterales bacterium]|nr:hypothetical protein [Desulfobacterales bacterium]